MRTSKIKYTFVVRDFRYLLEICLALLKRGFTFLFSFTYIFILFSAFNKQKMWGGKSVTLEYLSISLSTTELFFSDHTQYIKVSSFSVSKKWDRNSPCTKAPAQPIRIRHRFYGVWHRLRGNAVTMVTRAKTRSTWGQWRSAFWWRP